MRLRFEGFPGIRWCSCLIALGAFALLALPMPIGRAADAAPAGAAAPTMDNAMSSAGWMEEVVIQLEREVRDDVRMLPETPAALVREWRSFDRNGSPLGALVNVGWVALAACLALLAEALVTRGLSTRARHAMRLRPDGPTFGGLLSLLAFDIAGLAVVAGAFIYSRHWLTGVGVTVELIVLASNVLIRWRIVSVVLRLLLRPYDPPARLIDLPDDEAIRLARFLSVAILTVIMLVGFTRYYALMDVDSGASHVMALIAAIAVCAIYTWIVFRARAVAETLIRGPDGGLIGALRGAVARAWLVIGLTAVAALFVIFVFGLSLGLLSYYRAVSSTVGVILVLLVLERLTLRGWHRPEPATAGLPGRADILVAASFQRLLRSIALLITAVTLSWIWTDAVEMSPSGAARAMQETVAAVATLFVAYIAWELVRLAIDRHIQGVGPGPRLPGGDSDEEAAPVSRLQTVLPMLRVAFGGAIAIVAALIALSRLGIDTAPLIAGAGVFGLAISFGSQSLVRDIISGLFYMWDDAFRIGEYIDTGRLKGTVEALGVRSVKVRHHNGPLHTIPYGQLGAVTNMSRDFATIKFNLRLERDTDIELVRKTAKRIGIDMQQQPEIAAEVILPLKMQGIAEITDTAVVFRFKFTARPIKPSWVQREYLKRMYRDFAEKGISFASGALTLHTAPARAALPARSAGEAVRELAEAAAVPAGSPVSGQVA